MSTLTHDQDEALRRLAGHARDILKATAADEIAQPFGFDVEPLIYNDEGGPRVDWGARKEVWGEGLMVNGYTLALALQQHLGAPDIKYDTDYGGTGKRVEAYTIRAIKSIRVHAGEHLVSCEMCGTYDTYGALCWACERDLKAAYEPDVHKWPAAYQGDKDRWYVRLWASSSGKTFATKAEAVAHGRLQREARELSRERFAELLSTEGS